MTRFLWGSLAAGLTLASPVLAQDEEEEAGGPLVRLLENTLSNDSRNIEVNGLEGALSSRATIQELIVSDPDGPWFILTGAVLDWNRLALVRGRFSVNSLSAEKIEVIRPPLPDPNAPVELPDPEAEPFALPELPVAIEIGEIQVAEIALGEELLGRSASLSVNGNLTLADGALDTLLSVNRLDRQGDALTLGASYANETQNIGVDITLTEAEGGLLTELLQMPGNPSLVFTAQGDGPIDAFRTDIGLATDGVRRVEGHVELNGVPVEGSEEQGIGFTADIGGDLTPLLAEDFHDFFGESTDLDVVGLRAADGRLTVDTLSLVSSALNISGGLAISADGAPEFVSLEGSITPAEGEDVIVLPVPGGDTTIRSVQLNGGMDATAGDDWALSLDAVGFSNPGIELEDVSLDAGGKIDLTDGLALNGDIEAAVSGLTVPDPTLSDTIGTDMTLTGAFDMPGDGTLGLSDFVIAGAGLEANANARINGLNSGFDLDGAASVNASDLSRFAALAGRPLAGSLSADLTGQGNPLGGQFDLVMTGTANDLQVGIPQADALLDGETLVTLDAARGPGGIELRKFEINGAQVTALGTGAVRTTGTTLDLTTNLTDLGLVVPQYEGPATLTAALAQNPRSEEWDAQIRFDGPDTMFADVAGTVTSKGGADVTYSAEMPGLEKFVPQLVGSATLAGAVQRDEDTGAADATVRLDGPGLFADIQATLDDAGMAEATYAAELSQLEAFVPQLVGAAKLDGQVTGDVNAQRFEGNVRVDGPEALFADIDGAYDAEGSTNVEYEAELGKLELFVPQLVGLARVSGALERADAASDWMADVTVNAPENIFAEVNGTLSPDGDAAVDYRASIPRLETFVAQLPGPARLNGQVQRDEAAGVWSTATRLDAPQGIFADINGTMTDGGTADLRYLAEVPSTETFVPQMAGASRLTGQVNRDEALDWLGNLQLDAPTNILADIKAELSADGIADATYFVQVPQVETFVAQLPGDARLWGEATGDLNKQAFEGVVRVTAPDQIIANIEGAYVQNGAAQMTYNAEVPQLEKFVAQLPGLLQLSGAVNSPDGQSWSGNAALRAPQEIAADVTGSLDKGGAIDVAYQADLPRLQAFVPQLPGAASLGGQVTRDAGGTDWKGATRFDGPDGIFVDASGTLSEGGDADITYDAEFPRTERFVPDFPGTLRSNGTAQRAAGVWTVDVDTETPASGAVTVDGTYDEASGNADIQAAGQLQLGAVNSFIQPNSIQGPLSFELAVQGPPSVDAVSGQISMNGVEIAVPQIQNAITGFGGTVGLNGGSANIALAGNMRTGGGFRIDGPVGLAAPFNGTIDIQFLQMILTDQVVYETIVGGGLRIAGPLTGAATVSGQIDIGETEINIATAGGAPGAAPIPELTHVGEPSNVYVTRERAGLVVEEDDGSGGGGGGPAIGLDIVISMPNKIFVRGRGLDAELGGALEIKGTTANIRPSGEISLIRGRLDFLTRRLDLTKGIVTLLGTLEPYIEFGATTETSEGSATLNIEGPATAPEITITSDPERPSEEALAMLVFGDQFTNLSPLKVAQLAAGFARLTGSGGGLTDSAREGAGLSSLDLTTDDEGNAAVGAGTYISENIYTDVIVNTRGDTELNINLGVTDSLSVKGSVDNEGDTSLGVFFERDY